MWGYLGILRDNGMDDIMIYFHNDDKQKYSFCILKLLVEKFEPIDKNSTKVTKVFEPKCFKSFGTRILYSPISSLPL